MAVERGEPLRQRFRKNGVGEKSLFSIREALALQRLGPAGSCLVDANGASFSSLYAVPRGHVHIAPVDKVPQSTRVGATYSTSATLRWILPERRWGDDCRAARPPTAAGTRTVLDRNLKPKLETHFSDILGVAHATCPRVPHTHIAT